MERKEKHDETEDTGGFRVQEVCETYGLKRDLLPRLTGYSTRAIANWASGRKPSEGTARHWAETERLLEAVSEVIQAERVGAWLKAPNKAFEGSTPLQVIERGESGRIWLMIHELASGQPG